MFPRVIAAARLAGFSFCVALVAGACNVDWMYPDRQLRAEQEPAVYAAKLRATDPAAQGVDITMVDAHEVDLVEGVVQPRPGNQGCLGGP